MKEKTFTWRAPVVLKYLLWNILFLTCMTALPAYAQDNAMLYKEIQLSQKWYTFDELTHAIQQQTGITFSYNASKINAEKKFRVKSERITALKLLKFIKAKSGISYKMIQPDFIVYQAPKNVPHKPRKKSLKKKKEKEVEHTVAGKSKHSSLQMKQTKPIAAVGFPKRDSNAQTVVVIGDSATASDYYFSGGSGGGGSMGTIEMVMRYPGGDKQTVNPYASLNPPGGQHQKPAGDWQEPDVGAFFRNNLLLGVGISADETYYLSTTLHFGFRFLYATLSYNVGAYSQARYGLGTEAKINDRWALQAGFNTGKRFSESYTYTRHDIFIPQPDSINPNPPPIIIETDVPFFARSQLTRFSLSVVRQFNKNLSISGSIILNRLSTQYFSRDQPFDLNSTGLPITDAENRYRTLKPPYVLNRSYYQPDARLIQLWLGFRISVFYRLNFSDG